MIIISTQLYTYIRSDQHGALVAVGCGCGMSGSGEARVSVITSSGMVA